MTRARATATGFTAVMLWSLLALFTVFAAPVPPLQLNAVCFALGGLLGLIWIARNGNWARLRNVRWPVYVFGTTGLFGYHFLYFSALRAAPAAEAGLIAYLWPLLIVVLSGLLPGERLRPAHVIGGAISFAGAALVVLGDATGFESDHMAGYLLAGGCALTWSTYSVLSRRLGKTPTESVAVFCLLTAGLSCAAHLWLEDTVWPARASGWVAMLALGLGPVGLAFYVWDIGVKRGDIQILGVASYTAPLLSTLALIAAGVAEPRWAILGAAVLIAGGALLAARAGGRTARPS